LSEINSLILFGYVLNREENINDDAILDITDTSSHRAKMTKAQVKRLIGWDS